MAYSNRRAVKSEEVKMSCTKAQRRQWEQVAEMMGLPLSAYARRCVDMATRAYLKSKGLEFDVQTGEIRVRR